MVPAAVTGWVGAYLGTSGSASVGSGVVVMAAAVVSAGVVARGQPVTGTRSTVWLAAAAVLVGIGALLGGHGRVVALAAGPVDDAASARAQVSLLLRVTSDPLPRSLPAGAPAWQRNQVRLGATVVRADVNRAPPQRVSTPVVVLAPTTWATLHPGDLVAADGRLREPSRAGPVAAIVDVRDDPVVVGRRPSPLTLGNQPRRALRESVSGFDPNRGGLLPSLVVGDETLLTPKVQEQLRATGLAHLTAVSGANVAIVLGAVLLGARWLGARGWTLPALGLASVLVFVLIARPEPSVLRAASMGVVVVLGLVAGRGGRGIAPLALAVSLLLLADPWLARNWGFALSCAATAGIVVLARPWARSAAAWMPRPLAAALSVPLAAQLACTPLLVGMTGEVSLSAVPANLLAAPAVPAATVLGIAAAVIGVASPAAAHVLAGVAMLPTGWIVLVAERAAGLPGTVLTWHWGVPLALAGTAGLVLVTPVVLRSRLAFVAVSAAMAAALFRPSTGWPPPDWSIVVCDVGQGDALVLRSGPHEALVYDAGPDPHAVDRCLQDLSVRSVPLLVVSHFDGDHVGGAEGVGWGRHVDRALITVLDEPVDPAEAFLAWARARSVEVIRARPGQHGRTGSVSWQVLWPERVIRAGSASNQASVVLRADVDGVSVLLTGDIEALAQAAVQRRANVDVDVLKVPHHGTADQDPTFFTEVRPAVALIGVGADNPYGHPAPEALDALDMLGVEVVRTDRDGDTALVPTETSRGRQIHVVRRGPR